MPLEPDNNIDELLQAYAKKRREQMRAPLEVHPATRNLLQAEVARTFPRKSSAAESWLESLKMFWPRVAFALSILLVLGVGSWSLLQSNREATPMKMSKLEKNAEPKSRLLESLSVRTANEPSAPEEKTVELGLNQPLREVKAVSDEARQFAP